MSLLGALLLANAVGVLATTGISDLSSEPCDFGEIYAFSSTSCDITFGNDSDEAIHLVSITPAMPGDASESAELTIAPHGKAYLNVRVDAGNTNGPSSHRFRFQIADAAEKRDALVLAHGFVMSALDEPLPAIDFGIVNIDTKTPEKSITLGSHETASFRILKVIDKPSWVDAALSADGSTLKVRMLASAPLGVRAQFIKLVIDSPRQKQAWVSVTADVRGDVVPAMNPLSVGVIKVSDRNEFRIPLVSHSGKDFKIGKISFEDVKGDTRVTACEPATRGCRWLQLTISKDQPLGSIKGSLLIEFPEQRRTLRIAVTGLMVRDDFKVKTLDPEAVANGAASSASRAATPNLGEALKHSVEAQAPAQTAPLPGAGPLLKWTVANGRTLYGFQIFRSTDPDGPFVLQNVPALRAQAEDDSPKAFQWRDNSAESGKTYWYYIGTVDLNGRKARLTSPQKVVAK